MGKMKLVLVGNGMAGMRTLEELLKAAPDLYDITVFGDEPHPNYNRIVMMTNGPAATIGEIVDVDLARPRDRLNLAENPHYHHLRGRVLEFLYQKHRKAA